MTSLRFTVTESDTAIALGSGDVPVLATPRLLAWLEAATVRAARPGPGETTVGVEVALRHMRPSAVGAHLEIAVTAVTRTGRRMAFEVEARELVPAAGSPAGAAPAGTPPAATPAPLVARGQVLRVAVHRDEFLAGLG